MCGECSLYGKDDKIQGILFWEPEVKKPNGIRRRRKKTIKWWQTTKFWKKIKWFLKKYDVKKWTGFIWLRQGPEPG